MATAVDQAARIEALLASADARIRRAFLDITQSIKSDLSLKEIADLIESGRVADAVHRAGADFGGRLSNETSSIFQISSNKMATFFAGALELNVDFDITNTRAVRFLRDDRLRLIQAMTADVRGSVRQALVRGTQAGINPRAQARLFRDAIGLTPFQERAVDNYRDLLRGGNAEALERELRDRRFDPRVKRAFADGRALSTKEIDRMTVRYRERYLKYRSEVIARTESLRAVHAGQRELIDQAVGEGKVDPTKLSFEWNTRLDGRERQSHQVMHGQIRKLTGSGAGPFVSGAGNSLRFPGDPFAPASETIQCRCVVTTRVSGVSPAGAKSVPPAPKPRPKPKPRRKAPPRPRVPPKPKRTAPLPQAQRRDAVLAPSRAPWRETMSTLEKNHMKRLAADAPVPFKNWFNITFPVSRQTTHRKAAYFNQTHAISMPLKPKDAGAVTTWAHELGHAIDMNGKSAKDAISMNLGKAIKKEAAGMPDIDSVTAKAVATNRRKMTTLDDFYISDEAGFDHRKALGKFTETWPDGAGAELKALRLSDKAKLDFAALWESGRWETAIKGIRRDIQVRKLDLRFGRVPGSTRKDLQRIQTFENMMGKLSDAIESASLYRRAGHLNGLSGHGRKYGFSFGIDPASEVPRAAMLEYFANAYTAHTVEGWPLYSHLLEMATPKTTAAFRELAERMV